jgi:hypothetical protein
MPAQLTRPISLPIAGGGGHHGLAVGLLADVALDEAPPISLATASPRSTCRSAMTTLPPCAASMRAVPSPRPEAPPVTMKTLPAMSMCLLLLG